MTAVSGYNILQYKTEYPEQTPYIAKFYKIKRWYR